MKLLLLVQALAGLRVVARLLATGRGRRVGVVEPGLVPARAVSVLVPVLDEALRLPACLDGLGGLGPEVAEVVVVDGGSRDGTADVARAYAARDRRVRLVQTGPIPDGWNGKARGLDVGSRHADPTTTWLLTVDADVLVQPALARSLVAHASRCGVPALSVATLQVLSGAAEALVHPALLTTLVYRFGIPGHATTDPSVVQANGQCCLMRRDVLRSVGGFGVARASLCEDVTLARTLAAAGVPVGFYETDGLVATAMYGGWRQALAGWTRSLPLRDQYFGIGGWLGLAELALVQALPLVIVGGLLLARRWGALGRLNGLLLLVRLGVLCGTARAYPRRPATYWLSPLFDPLVVPAIVASALRRRHTWRGRSYAVRHGALQPDHGRR